MASQCARFDKQLQAYLGSAGIIAHSDCLHIMIYDAEMIRLLLDKFLANEDAVPQL